MLRQLVQDLRSGEVEVVDLPDPVPGEREVLVRTTWSLISPGTEQAQAETAGKSLIGKARERPDQVRKVLDRAARDGVKSAISAVQARLEDLRTPGYSSAGIVEALGPSVTGLRRGDRVACVGADVACHAERIVAPAPLCLPLPPQLEERWGAFAAIGGVAAHALRVAGVEPGTRVAVIGLGLVGQIAAQLITAAGARAIGFDLSPERALLAKRHGAAAVGVVGADDPWEIVADLTGGVGADAIVVAAASKRNQPVELAAQLARDRATIAVVGDVPIEAPRRVFYEKELQLRVSRSYGPGRYDPAYERSGHDYPVGYVRWTERRLIEYFLEEVADHRVRLEELVSHEFPVERGAEAYAALASGSRMAILLRYGATPPRPARRAQLRARDAARSGSLRIGVIGPGLFARTTLLPALERLGVEIAGVAGHSPARAFGLARRRSAEYAAADADELLRDRSVDAVVIATRHDSHAELAARALEGGKAVFLEKPMAIEEAGVERLRPLLEAGERLVVDFNRSLAPATERLRRHWSGRADPLSIHHRVNAGYLEPGHWQRDRRVGGGRLVGEACHFIDLCSVLIGQPLSSVQVVPVGVGPATLEGDNFVLVLRYADGSAATITYASSGDSALAKERLEVIGARRSAVVDDFRRVQLHAGRRRTGDRVPRPQDKGHEAILAAALRFFREGGDPPIPYERLIETTRASLLARDALDAGRLDPIDVHPL